MTKAFIANPWAACLGTHPATREITVYLLDLRITEVVSTKTFDPNQAAEAVDLYEAHVYNIKYTF